VDAFCLDLSYAVWNEFSIQFLIDIRHAFAFGLSFLHLQLLRPPYSDINGVSECVKAYCFCRGSVTGG
jgi:hypothetical protein